MPANGSSSKSDDQPGTATGVPFGGHSALPASAHGSVEDGLRRDVKTEIVRAPGAGEGAPVLAVPRAQWRAASVASPRRRSVRGWHAALEAAALSGVGAESTAARRHAWRKRRCRFVAGETDCSDRALVWNLHG
jgi:hypothetical protein